jgi:hypothetical protein
VALAHTWRANDAGDVETPCVAALHRGHAVSGFTPPQQSLIETLKVVWGIFYASSEQRFLSDIRHILLVPTYYGKSDHRNKIKEIDCRTDVSKTIDPKMSIVLYMVKLPIFHLLTWR